jgi:glycosyltransferase involved in cell wall biosynthesis
VLIAHVYHHYYPVIGGLERAVQSLAEELAKLGHEVHVITSRYDAKNRARGGNR